MLPKIKIAYQNGNLGTVAPNEDGLLLLCAKGAAVASTFTADKPYKIFRPGGLEALGVTAENNASLHKAVIQFYTEAPEGTPLYIMAYTAANMTALCDKDTGKLRGVLQMLKGAIRGVVLLHADGAAESATGLSKDVYDMLPKAQVLGDWTATELYAPIFFLVDGYGYTGKANDLKDLTKEKYNRSLVFIGNEDSKDKHSAIGYLAGRVARIQVCRNIGRVRDGSVNAPLLHLGTVPIEEAMDDVAAIYDKGYVCPRVHVGRSGYYFTDDSMAVVTTDDYAHLTARRTIDKVVRIAYDTLLNTLLDEVELNDDGTMQESVLHSIEADVEKAINASMTAAGELASVDESGVECTIDASQNIKATSTIEVAIAVRPFGYPRTIVANVGFIVESED